MNKYILILFICSYFVLNLFDNKILAEELEEVEKRVYNVERKLKGKIPVLPVDSELLNLSGFISGNQLFLRGKGYRDGKSSETTRSLLFIHSLVLSGKIYDNISYLISPMFLYYDNIHNLDSVNRANHTTTSTFVPRAYGIYEFNKYFNMQVGRFVAPAGAYFETWDWVSDKLPMLKYLHVNPVRGILYNHVTDGVNIYGVTQINNVKMKYYLYGGYHSYMPPKDLLDDELKKAYNEAFPQKFYWGGRLKFSLYDNAVNLGLNYQTGQRVEGFNVYGIDLRAKYKLFGLKIEYVVTNEDDVADYKDASTLVNDLMLGLQTNNIALVGSAQNGMVEYLRTRLDSTKKSFYFEPFYRIGNRWTLVSRYEYFEPNTVMHTNGSIIDIYSLGIVFDPIPSFRLRFVAQKHDYRDKEAHGIFDEGVQGNPAAAAVVYGESKQLEYNKIDPDYMQFEMTFVMNF